MVVYKMVVLTEIDYFSIGASIFGFVLFLYSAYVAMNIVKLLPEKSKARKNWYFAVIAILMFLMGYVVNIIAILGEYTELRDLMVPVVYVFGALFVLIMTTLSLRTYKIILESTE